LTHQVCDILERKEIWRQYHRNDQQQNEYEKRIIVVDKYQNIANICFFLRP
jgi:hypothetical protein